MSSLKPNISEPCNITVDSGSLQLTTDENGTLKIEGLDPDSLKGCANQMVEDASSSKDERFGGRRRSRRRKSSRKKAHKKRKRTNRRRK